MRERERERERYKRKNEKKWIKEERELNLISSRITTIIEQYFIFVQILCTICKNRSREKKN